MICGSLGYYMVAAWHTSKKQVSDSNQQMSGRKGCLITAVLWLGSSLIGHLVPFFWCKVA